MWEWVAGSEPLLRWGRRKLLTLPGLTVQACAWPYFAEELDKALVFR